MERFAEEVEADELTVDWRRDGDADVLIRDRTAGGLGRKLFDADCYPSFAASNTGNGEYFGLCECRRI